jgi:hypothetical protein
VDAVPRHAALTSAALSAGKPCFAFLPPPAPSFFLIPPPPPLSFKAQLEAERLETAGEGEDSSDERQRLVNEDIAAGEAPNSLLTPNSTFNARPYPPFHNSK